MAATKYEELFTELLTLTNVFSETSANLLYRICDVIASDLKKNESGASIQQIPFLRLKQFVEDCLVTRVNNYVLSFSLKLFSLYLYHDATTNDASSILHKILVYIDDQRGSGTISDRPSVIEENATIECFTQALHNAKAAEWIVSHVKDILRVVWRILDDQRSIYLNQTCCKFLVELIVYLDKMASNDTPRHEESYLSSSCLIDSLWCQFHQSKSSSIHSRVNSERPHSLNLSYLDVMKELCVRECCIQTVCLKDGRLNQLLDMLECKQAAPIVLDIISSFVKYEHNRKNAAVDDVTRAVYDRLLWLMANKQTFAQAHRSLISFLLSVPDEADVTCNLPSLILVPLWEVLGTTNASQVPPGIVLVAQDIMRNKKASVAILCDILTAGSHNLMREEIYIRVPALLSHIANIANKEATDITNSYSRHLRHNAKLLSSVLKFILAFEGMKPCPHPQQSHLVDQLVTVADAVDVSSSTVSLLCKVFFNFSVCEKGDDRNDERTDKSAGRVAEWILARMCDPQWEVRDTVVEFVEDVAEAASANAGARIWLTHHNVLVNLWSTLTDTEAYVRAAVLKSLRICVQSIPQLLLSATKTKNAVTVAAVDILGNDPEAFARRAAVDLLMALYHSSINSGDDTDLIHLAMYTAVIKDFDWEVKLGALRFWQSVLEFNLTSVIPTSDNISTHSPNRPLTEQTFGLICPRLLNTRCAQSIVAAMADCDPSVVQSALRTLLSFVSLIPLELLSDGCDPSPNPLDVIEASSELCRSEPEQLTPVLFKATLTSTRQLYAGKTLDVYEESLTTIIDDFMATLTPATDLHCLSDQDDDVILDCY